MKTLLILLLLTTSVYAYDDISPSENRRNWQINEQNNILRQERTDYLLNERRDRRRDNINQDYHQYDNYNTYDDYDYYR